MKKGDKLKKSGGDIMTVRSRDVIVYKNSPFDICKATAASLWKSAFIRDTFVRDRETFEKYQRSVTGDLAKLCVKRWIEENGLECIDWDDVRTSWKSQRKRFDLNVNDHDIEVRSSISSYPTIQEVLRNEHIIHPSNVRVKEITVQVFFKDSSCTEAWLCGWTLRNHLEDDNLRSPRRIGRYLVDFYFMPFDHRNARKIRDLLAFIS